MFKVRVASGANIDYETSPNHTRQIHVQAEDPNTNTNSSWLNITVTDQLIEPVINSQTPSNNSVNVSMSLSQFSVNIQDKKMRFIA